MSWLDQAKVHFSQTRQSGTAETAETHADFLNMRQSGTAETAEKGVLTVLAVHPERICKKRDFPIQTESAPSDPALVSASDVEQDLDRWCWPRSSAMNTAEIDLSAKRVDQFIHRGLPQPEAERLADKLVLRDRTADDRRVCFECHHLRDIGADRWRCANARAAGIPRDGLPGDLLRQLQRCPGFGLEASLNQSDSPAFGMPCP